MDRPVYEQAGLDPLQPVLCAGSLNAPMAFLGRDLGRDEVLRGQPLIGGAGRRVRRAVYARATGHEAPSGDALLSEALDLALLTNTVPFKPVGNKAYPRAVREAMRPHVAALLACLWTGGIVVTLGTEAWEWLRPYADGAAMDALWARPDRYERTLACVLRAECGGRAVERAVSVAPLPHPSPLNRTYWDAFPALLQARIDSLG